jgi:hypothetical protein
MRVTLLTLPLFLLLSASLSASERSPDGRPHFSGKEADSIKEAFQHLEEGNEKLESYLEGDSIAAADLAHVHELTYTLEKALGKIQGSVNRMVTTLEEVHLASEKGDADRVLEFGREYLSIGEEFAD